MIVAIAQRRRLQPVTCRYFVALAHYRPTMHSITRATASAFATTVIAATAQRRRLQPVMCVHFVRMAYYDVLLMLVLEQQLLVRLLL